MGQFFSTLFIQIIELPRSIVCIAVIHFFYFQCIKLKLGTNRGEKGSGSKQVARKGRVLAKSLSMRLEVNELHKALQCVFEQDTLSSAKC